MSELVKLLALKQRCFNLANGEWGNRPAQPIKIIINQFKTVTDLLNSKYKEFAGLDLHDYDSYYMPGIDRYTFDVFKAIRIDIDYYISILKPLQEQTNKSVTINKEGIFVAGQEYEALSAILEIIKTAQNEILFVDGYIDKKNIDIFHEAANIKKIKIITKQISLTPSLKVLVDKFNIQNNNNLEIKSFELFHDRFLLIDGNEYFHLGSSIKDAGKKSFMFSRIEEPFVKDLLLKEFNKVWQSIPNVF